jgi:hypothetical protein
MDILKEHGIGGGGGLKTADKLALINLANQADLNNSSVKTNITGKIGSPTLSNDTWTKIGTDILAQKTSLATKLVDLGKSSTDTESLKCLVDKVVGGISFTSPTTSLIVDAGETIVVGDSLVYDSSGKCKKAITDKELVIAENLLSFNDMDINIVDFIKLSPTLLLLLATSRTVAGTIDFVTFTINGDGSLTKNAIVRKTAGNTGSQNWIIKKIDSSSALVCYSGGTVKEIRAFVLSISGTGVVTYGAEVILYTGSSSYNIPIMNAIVPIISGKFFCAFSGNSNNQLYNTVMMVLISVSGTTITVGTIKVPAVGSFGDVWFAGKNSDTEAYVMYSLAGSNDGYLVCYCGLNTSTLIVTASAGSYLYRGDTTAYPTGKFVRKTSNEMDGAMLWVNGAYRVYLEKITHQVGAIPSVAKDTPFQLCPGNMTTYSILNLEDNELYTVVGVIADTNIYASAYTNGHLLHLASTNITKLATDCCLRLAQGGSKDSIYILIGNSGTAQRIQKMRFSKKPNALAKSGGTAGQTIQAILLI